MDACFPQMVPYVFQLLHFDEVVPHDPDNVHYPQLTVKAIQLYLQPPCVFAL